MSRTNILRGLVSLVSTVLVFAIIMTNTAFSFQSIINSTLNTKSVEWVYWMKEVMRFILEATMVA